MEVPHPPRHLASRVFGPAGWSNDPERAYDELGDQTKRALLDLLPDGWSFENKRVLDFGCGAGRTLRHFLGEAEQAEVWGADIDAPSIEWLEANLCPPLRAWHCAVWPPLALEHGSFDLVWAISVFTHLTDNSLPWLLELQRLLKPGGLLIATYMGRWNSELLAHEPWEEDRAGMNVLHHDRPWDEGGPAVLISDWWVEEHWGRAFEILATTPELHNMTWLLMRKREVEVTSADLERPANDPRELAAVRHNLRQVRRELEAVAQRERSQRRWIEELERTLEERTARLDRIESSLVWRATARLRRLRRRC